MICRARSDRDTILVTYEKLMDLGGLPRIGRSLSGRDELVKLFLFDIFLFFLCF